MTTPCRRALAGPAHVADTSTGPPSVRYQRAAVVPGTRRLGTLTSISEFEVTALVLSEHEAFRRAFADLEGADDVGAAWQQLADRLEVHAVAEEELFYPELAEVADDGEAEAVTGVREHNDIREAVRAVAALTPGETDWWDAVGTAQEVNAEHMAEEEREFIPDFRDGVDAARREDLGMRWLQFHDEHDGAAGLDGDDADPQAVAGTT